MEEFQRIKRLPPYVFNIVNELKAKQRAEGVDIIDFGMGNPDRATPQHIVDKLIEVSQKGTAHRYSVSKGIIRLRKAICGWYERRFGVELDPDSQAIVTIGSKEGLAHLAMATMGPGDAALVPNPAYPIHPYGFVLAGADVRHVPLIPGVDFFEELEKAIKTSWPKPKMLVLNFPGNPTTQCVDLEFFEKVVALAREYKIWVVHDIAYADIVFDGYVAPSILQVPGATDVAVEFFTLSKSYNMPGWRVGFMCGNRELVAALGRIKSYLDYGTFAPIQVAAITALEGPQDCVQEICDILGITTRITSTESYTLEGDRSARLAAVCTQAGADCYLSGPAAKSYLDEEVFSTRGIRVEWFSYAGYPLYPQLWGEFEHSVSVLDLLFNCGPEAANYMLFNLRTKN
ncbi:MAG: aminotransferase class I/II-fold pyridoxal phosphate-dependent enzyme [Gammaproteobacteria bacterium]|nr:aminotransferase class I/II-fold pyridoxal phosphate-dependent enzyme [Gammaproteobacteria bacterium]